MIFLAPGSIRFPTFVQQTPLAYVADFKRERDMSLTKFSNIGLAKNSFVLGADFRHKLLLRLAGTRYLARYDSIFHKRSLSWNDSELVNRKSFSLPLQIMASTTVLIRVQLDVSICVACDEK